MALLNLDNLVDVFCECLEITFLGEGELRVILQRIHELKPGLRSSGNLTAGEITYLQRLRRTGKGRGDD